MGTLGKSPQECQERCQKQDNCEYFSWWSDHGCKLAGKGAELKTSSKPPVSGPRNCAVRSKPASVTPPKPEEPSKPEEEEGQKVEEERRRKDAEAKKKQQEEEEAARKKKEEEEAARKKKEDEE